MRVISGKYRGMNLCSPKGGGVRPTADRVKESLFNILAARVAGARTLDLFCGSGSLGIECLSRGCAFARLNDLSPESALCARKNLSKLGESNYLLTISDFRACLAEGERYDLIFIDPPYASESGAQALGIIGADKLLLSGGVAVYERDVPFTQKIKGLVLFDERKYGRTYLGFFRREEEEV